MIAADDSSFEAFMAQRHRPLLRFAMVLTGDAGASEEIVSDVLSRAWERWDHIGGLDHPAAYVRRMIVNEFMTNRRRSGRISLRGDLASLFDDSGQNVADYAVAHAERSELVAALAKLPRKQRAVLVLRFYEDLSDGEIAAILGCKHATVRSITSRGLAALRIRMDASELATQTTGPIRSLTVGEI